MNIHQEDKKIPAHGGYGAAILHPHWKKKRKEILARDQNRCVICHATDMLQVHHRQYLFSKSKNIFNEPWDYPNRLLITLCERCHQRGHRLYKVPIRTIK